MLKNEILPAAVIFVCFLSVLFAASAKALDYPEFNIGTGQRSTNDWVGSSQEEKTTFDFMVFAHQKITKNTELMIVHSSDLMRHEKDYGLNYASFNVKYSLYLVDLRGGVGVVERHPSNEAIRTNPTLFASIGAPTGPNMSWSWSIIKSVEKGQDGVRFFSVQFGILYRVY